VCVCQDSKTVVDKFKSGFLPPGDIAFEDLSVLGIGGGGTNGNDIHVSQSNVVRPSMRSDSMKGSLAAVGMRSKKRSKILGLFSSSKVYISIVLSLSLSLSLCL